MADQKKKQAFIVKDFKDAGTEQSFSKGDTVSIDEGAFANYELAGLVRTPTAEDKKQAAAPAA